MRLSVVVSISNRNILVGPRLTFPYGNNCFLTYITDKLLTQVQNQKIAQYTTNLKTLYFSKKFLKKFLGMVKIVNINDMSDLRKMAKFKLQFTSKK